MDNPLLRRRINGLVDRREHLDRLILLPVLHEIAELAHHRLHVGIEWLATRTTVNALTRGFDGGLRYWHSPGRVQEFSVAAREGRRGLKGLRRQRGVKRHHKFLSVVFALFTLFALSQTDQNLAPPS